ncbi:hypothetical protein EDB19DRAFT_1831753 [Suillus lakei]|nr:hypothetical protein EDB19DRAFT_1831753 [Suillus lakei]
MVMALVVPELTVVWAMRQWFSARHITRQFNDSGYLNVQCPQERPGSNERVGTPEVQYKVTLDILSWIRVRIEVPITHSEGNTGTQTLAGRFKKWLKACFQSNLKTHSFFALMGGFMLYVDGEPYHTLQPDELLELIRKGCINPLILTAKQIQDNSKGTAISKGFIILQLEVATIASAVFSVVTYAVWWNKPFDVQSPHPIYWNSTASKPEDHIHEHIYSSMCFAPEYICRSVFDDDNNAFVEILRVVTCAFNELMVVYDTPTSRKLRVPTFDGSINLDCSHGIFLGCAGLLMAIVYGSILCIAWFYAFPTYQEQVPWRISSVVIVYAPTPLILRAGCIVELLADPASILEDVLASVVIPIWMTLQMIARITLLTLMVTTLRDLPPGAYNAASWSNLVPHL